MRVSSLTIRKLTLLVGDIAFFYASLLISLLIRYESEWQTAIATHLLPFTIVLGIGVVIFYAMRLYDPLVGHGPTSWLQSTLAALLLHFFGAVFFFYFFSRSQGTISPRGTLFLFFLVFSAIFILWRKSARSLLQKQFHEKTLVLGDSPASQNLAKWLKEHPESGYILRSLVPTSSISNESLHELIKAGAIDTIIASRESLEHIAPTILRMSKDQMVGQGVNYWDLASFYETRLEKIPLEYVDDVWVLQNVIRRESTTSMLLKAFLDRAMAFTLLTLSLPLWPLIALLVRLSSPGPILYQQVRVGQHNKIFKLRKFRTMRVDAELHGPQWSTSNDPRVTGIGKVLRRAHLDELPQLLNVLMGDMSFVGPRPERPEFVKGLSEKILHYNVRHLIKPGFSGWAQLNYPYGASIEDAEGKLEYDFYYLKHRSMLLDFSIFLKTLRLLFYNPQR